MLSIPWDKLEKLQHDIGPELASILNKSGAAAAKSMKSLNVTISFDMTNPAAVEWIKRSAAELIELNIMPTSKEAIRNILTRSFEEGITAADSARLIREQIGILPRHAEAVEKYRQEMIALFEERGWITARQDANRLAGQYAQKLINYRAKNIARTESIRAANQGQQTLWEDAINKDLLTEADWEREWIASDPCPICTALDGTRAGMRESFEGGYFMPPDPHVNCRCSVGLVEKE